MERSRPAFALPAGAANEAAYASTTPAPTSIGSSEAAPRVVAVSAYLTRFGAQVGLACSIRATLPDTTPVAIDVPLPFRYAPST